MASAAMAGPPLASQPSDDKGDVDMANVPSEQLDNDALRTRMASRKYKASELPLSSATRAAVESLMNNFKKKGGYDAIRKQVWDKFEAGVSCSILEMRAILSILVICRIDSL